MYRTSINKSAYLNELVGVLPEHGGVLLDLLVSAVASGLDEDQQGHTGLQEAVGNMVHHRFAQLPSQVARLAAHVVDRALQALRLLLHAHLNIVTKSLTLRSSGEGV